MSDHRRPAGASGQKRELERDIERTRAELADTVQALAYKADLPARARDAAGGLGAAARHRSADPTVRRIGAVGAGVALAVAAFWLARRRSSR